MPISSSQIRGSLSAGSGSSSWGVGWCGGLTVRVAHKHIIVIFDGVYSNRTHSNRLRSFLEARVEDSYRRNVARIVPLLQVAVPQYMPNSFYSNSDVLRHYLPV